MARITGEQTSRPIALTINDWSFMRVPQTLYQRLFDRLSDLIPHLPSVQSGQSFKAPPRIQGDMEIFLDVLGVDGAVVELQIAHDKIGAVDPAPWMTFGVNLSTSTAEVLAVMDDWKYEAAYSDRQAPNPRRVPMNTMALNWLTIMLNHGAHFQPCPSTVSTLTN
jgi:uncharacterized protein YqiB (DUF1249 family)